MMTMDIVPFSESHYEMIKDWWQSYGELPPDIKYMPSTSFVMYCDSEPILCVSLFLTNSPIAWVDFYVGNPKLKNADRKECGRLIVKHLELVAKKNGKEKLVCMSMNEKLSNRYQELGFTPTASQISVFVKEIQ